MSGLSVYMSTLCVCVCVCVWPRMENKKCESVFLEHVVKVVEFRAYCGSGEMFVYDVERKKEIKRLGFDCLENVGIV